MRHSVKRPSVQLLRLLSFVESVLSKGFLGPQLVIITIITTIITTIIIITIIIIIAAQPDGETVELSGLRDMADGRRRGVVREGRE